MGDGHKIGNAMKGHHLSLTSAVQCVTNYKCVTNYNSDGITHGFTLGIN